MSRPTKEEAIHEAEESFERDCKSLFDLTRDERGEYVSSETQRYWVKYREGYLSTRGWK